MSAVVTATQTMTRGTSQERVRLMAPALSGAWAARLVILMVALAGVLAALGRAPLAWDGAGYAFDALNAQQPFAPMGRLINVPLQLPALLGQRLGLPLPVLLVLFGLPYALLPALSLALSWWVVRRDAPHLFVWPALGLGLVTLPGQMFWVAEGLFVVQVAWPLWLAVLLGLPRRLWGLCALLVAAIVLCHPTAAAVLGVTALLAGSVALRTGAPRLWLLAALCAGLAALRYHLLAVGYERDQASLSTLLGTAGRALAGWPLLTVLCALLVGLLLLGPGDARRWRSAAIVGLLALLALGLLGWAANPWAWGGAFEFRRWALPATLPLLLLCAVDARRGRGAAGSPGAARARVCLLAALLLCAVIAVQTVALDRLGAQMAHALARTAAPCLSAWTLPAARGTALEGVGLPAYSVLLQGRRPHTVVSYGRGCGPALRSRGHGLYGPLPAGRGWIILPAAPPGAAR